MSTQVTVHREQRFTNCFNVHDAGNEMGLLIKNIESVYGQQSSLDEQALSHALNALFHPLAEVFSTHAPRLTPAPVPSRRNPIARKRWWKTSSGAQPQSCSSCASIR